MFEFGRTVALMARIRWDMSLYTLFPGGPTNNFQVLRIENVVLSDA